MSLVSGRFECEAWLHFQLCIKIVIEDQTSLNFGRFTGILQKEAEDYGREETNHGCEIVYRGACTHSNAEIRTKRGHGAYGTARFPLSSHRTEAFNCSR